MGGDDSEQTLQPARIDGEPGTLPLEIVAGGRYRVRRLLATGGMGEVYEAEDLVVGGPVALKTLRAELAASPGAVDGLRREIAVARKVTHPNVCRLYDVGEHEGRVFLSMELLAGPTLAAHLEERGHLPIDELERVTAQLVAGLGALHAAGIVHRDFKSSNVMVVGDRVVITDFGLARTVAPDREAVVTVEASLRGTPAYMAPEQVEGRAATRASDIYALGVVLFQLATGALPFRGDNALATATTRLYQDPPDPGTLRRDLPARWRRTILRCLARDPAARPPRIEDVLAAHRRRWWIAIAPAGLALAATMLAVGGLREKTEPRTADAGFDLSERTIRLHLDGLATWIDFSIDGKNLRYRDRSRAWRYDTTSGSERPFAEPDGNVELLPDGSRLVREQSASEWKFDIYREAPDTTQRSLLLEGVQGVAISRDGMRIAAVRGDTFVVHDRRDGSTRELPELGRVALTSDRGIRTAIMSWSPDGEHLLWTSSDDTKPATERLYLTRVRDATTRVVAAPIVSEDTTWRAADFIDDRHIIYCGNTRQGAAIVIRALDTGSEHIVRPLDPAVTNCYVAAAADRVAILLNRSANNLGVLDLGSSPRELRFVASDRKFRPVDMSEDGEHVYADAARPVAHDPHKPFEPASFLRIAHRTGEVTTLPNCPGAFYWIRYGAELVHVRGRVADSTVTMTLLQHGSCEAIAEWVLPPRTLWGVPRCDQDSCLLAGVEDAVGGAPARGGGPLRVVQLVVGKPPVEIARGDGSVGPGRRLSPDVARSADGQWIVAFAGAGGMPQIVGRAGGELRRIELGGTPQAIAPSRQPGSFLVTGIGLDGQLYALLRVGFDGSRELLWSSSHTFAGWLRSNPTNDTVTVFARDKRQELVLFERARSRSATRERSQ